MPVPCCSERGGSVVSNLFVFRLHRSPIITAFHRAQARNSLTEENPVDIIQTIVPFITAVGGAFAVPAFRYLRARANGSAQVELRRAQTDGEVRLKRIESENALVQFLISSLDEVKLELADVKSRVKLLEHERIDLHEKLAEARLDNTRLTGLLADRDEYITQLEKDHAAQAEKIDKLTTTIADRYRAAGA
jgi:hypothetical protein